MDALISLLTHLLIFGVVAGLLYWGRHARYEPLPAADR
jgi:hypothetical protein